MASDTQADLFLQIPSWLSCSFQWGWFPLRLCWCCSSLIRARPLVCSLGEGEAVCGAEARAGPAAWARSRGAAAAVPEHSPGKDKADQSKECPVSLGRGCREVCNEQCAFPRPGKQGYHCISSRGNTEQQTNFFLHVMLLYFIKIEERSNYNMS